jgi:hypothetical protein
MQGLFYLQFDSALTFSHFCNKLIYPLEKRVNKLTFAIKSVIYRIVVLSASQLRYFRGFSRELVQPVHKIDRES